jgi:S-adenosylmethionine-diacylgycerolhomoserine-N-methlytransferase
MSSPAGDARVLLRLLRGLPRRGLQRDRLQAFYAPQAGDYDAFRERLLHGRGELLSLMEFAPGQVLVDLGAGTGSNLESLGPVARRLARADLVDLCPALLDVAWRRFDAWDNVRIVEQDAAIYDPGIAADRVLFSYSLTMMPGWHEALQNALRWLKPGGLLGVVDFRMPTGWLAGTFWRRWFAHDGVRLDANHQSTLRASLELLHFREGRGRVPWLPLRAPYYLFVGRKPGG